jgi:hypothetical protein
LTRAANPATVLFLATALANISKSKERKYSGSYLRTKIRYNEWEHRGCQGTLNVWKAVSSPSVVRASNVGLLLSRPSPQDAVIPCRPSDISSPLRSSMTKKLMSSSMDPIRTPEASLISHYSTLTSIEQNDLTSQPQAEFSFGYTQSNGTEESLITPRSSSHPPHPYSPCHGKPLYLRYILVFTSRARI